MNNLFTAFILVPLLAAIVNLLAGRSNRYLPALISLAASFYLLVITITLYPTLTANRLLFCNLNFSWLPFNAAFFLDGLSYLFLLTINLIVPLIIIFSAVYLKKYSSPNKFFALYLCLIAGMNGTLLASNLFTLFLFLELAAMATYLLVAFSGEKDQLEAAMRYAVIGTVASLMLLLGIILLYAFTGSLLFTKIPSAFVTINHQIQILIAALFILGFGMKAAIIPFHAWLPDAHTAAPAPVSATLSGLLIKVLGVYCLVRIFYNVIGINPALANVLMVLGAISILAGVLLALGQWDFKRLLAYHSISQVGYIILGFGLATPLGIMGGLFHLFNHAIFKSLLFLNAGAIETTTGTRNLKELGGLNQKQPFTWATSFIASLSISGIPPFNGFWSKLFIILACIQAGHLWFALAAVLGSILTLASFLKVQKYAFFETLPDKLQGLKESPLLMLIPMITLALLCFLVGVFHNQIISSILNPAVLVVLKGTAFWAVGGK